MPKFTQNEVRLLEFVRDGLVYRQIAAKQNCAEQTIKNDFARIRHKLGASTKVDMIVFALQRGIIKLK